MQRPLVRLAVEIPRKLRKSFNKPTEMWLSGTFCGSMYPNREPTAILCYPLVELTNGGGESSWPKQLDCSYLCGAVALCTLAAVPVIFVFSRTVVLDVLDVLDVQP